MPSCRPAARHSSSSHRLNAWDFANRELKGQSCEGGSEPPPPPPTELDTDGDGISDDDEDSGDLNIAFGNEPTDPENPDSDGDGLSDGTEILNGTNPNDPNDPPPPPPPTQQVEADNLIAKIAELTGDKLINKGLSNQLTEAAQDAKQLLIAGTQVDIDAACDIINDMEETIVAATDNKMDPDEAQPSLLAASPAIGSTKSVLVANTCSDPAP